MHSEALKAQAMAGRFADNVRGLAAGSFHCCIILADGSTVFFGAAWIYC